VTSKVAPPATGAPAGPRIDLPPLAAAARLAGRRGRALLHAGRDDDGLGRWSLLAAEPTETLITRGRSIVILDAAGHAARRFTADPLDAIEAFAAAHGVDLAAASSAASASSEAPEPRLIGYLGYDLGRAIERLPAGPVLGHDLPDVWLGAYGAVARWRAGRIDDRGVVTHSLGEVVGPDRAARARLLHALATGPAHPGVAPALGPLLADDDGAHHQARVERIRDYIAAGDVYQVNLARRLVARVQAPGDALALYAALAEVAPAPYGMLLEGDGLTVLSGSPERFLALTGGRLETRPIKGTRRRLGDPTADRALATELAAAEKDGAEHLMIVDLERNDLGRVAVPGSVAVDRLGYVVELPALLHKVSQVSAQLRPGVGLAALLRATFPGGSITGAPKVRAMELIDELEPARRGPYCGALGYLGVGPRGGATLDLAIAIRIAVLTAGELRIHVGGGIVDDSIAAAELAETEDKAAGWRATLARIATARAPRT
jgi:para-aminobenzoate synthetase component 1